MNVEISLRAASIDDNVQKNSTVKSALKNIVFNDIWSHNFMNKKNRVILSYNWKLRSITNYLQQLEMESLGKPTNPESLFPYTGQTIYGGFGIQLNTHISNFYIKVLLKPQQILLLA